jgi:mannose-6-phosphate isomerase-like protein (cupin superfamily)
MTQLKGLVPKGWGSEFVWVTNDKYSAKFLNFETGGQFSMHFHRDKMETWYVQSGKFEVEIINTLDATISRKILTDGMIHHNDPLIPHRLTCLEQGTIIEVSTADSVEDNYRVLPGDSQK